MTVGTTIHGARNVVAGVFFVQCYGKIFSNIKSTEVFNKIFSRMRCLQRNEKDATYLKNAAKGRVNTKAP